MSYNNLAIYDYSILNSLSRLNGITFFCSAHYDLDENIKNICFKRVFSYNKISNKFIKLISYICSLCIILWLAFRQKPQIIHIQWIRVPFIDRFFIWAYMACGAKVVYTAHNLLPHDDLKRKSIKAYQPIYKLVTAIVVHAKSSKNELITDFNIESDKISVIEHGLVEIKHNDEAIVKISEDIVKKEGLSEKIILTSFGSQSIYKGIDIVNSYLKEHTPFLKENQVTFIIAGKTPEHYANSLVKNESVILLNRYITDDEYIALSRLSDVILLPYINISQSGVLMSALNESVPVLVSHVGGLYEPLQIADIGWDMGEPNYDSFAAMIKKLIVDKASVKAKKNDKEAWNKIHSYYSWDRIGKRTFNLYKTLVYNSKE